MTLLLVHLVDLQNFWLEVARGYHGKDPFSSNLTASNLGHALEVLLSILVYKREKKSG